MALLPGVGPIQVATSRILVPKEVQVHRSSVTGHLATGQSPTRPGYRSPGQCSDDYKSVNHRSPVIQSVVIGIRKNDCREKSTFTGQPITTQLATGHRSSTCISNFS